MRSSLSICVLYRSDALARLLTKYLSATPPGEKTGGRYVLTQFTSAKKFLNFIQQGIHHIDCLVLQDHPDLQTLLTNLQDQAVFLPTVVVQAAPVDLGTAVPKSEVPEPPSDVSEVPSSDVARFSDYSYHAATLALGEDELDQICLAIDQAISKFIQLSPVPQLSQPLPSSTEASEIPVMQRTLTLKTQQLRLAEKLKERLGYLGIYYKRNPENFLRYMTQPQREELLHQLKEDYREIILSYFSDEVNLNQKIDNFVNIAFFADVSVSQIVEIHMDLMDEFSKQLKLEGRSDEILQDYRLTLIDTIAHLCEMYRRSIPRES